MKLYARKIREREVLATRIVNCPIGIKDEFFCRARCPMRCGDECVYRIITVEIACEAIKNDESGHCAYLWTFDCFHCGQKAMILTASYSLVGSQGFCPACEAKYMYHRFVAAREKNIYYLAVSKPRYEIKEKKEDNGT